MHFKFTLRTAAASALLAAAFGIAALAVPRSTAATVPTLIVHNATSYPVELHYTINFKNRTNYKLEPGEYFQRDDVATFQLGGTLYYLGTTAEMPVQTFKTYAGKTRAGTIRELDKTHFRFTWD